MEKKRSKVKMRFAAIAAALLLFICFQAPAFAVPSASQDVISLYKMSLWGNGAKVTTSASSQYTRYRMSVSASTKGLKKNYYSVYLYNQKERYIESYDGISFYFHNQNDTDMKINLNLSVSAETNVSMSDSSFAVLETADHTLREIVYPKYGTVAIPAHFSGTVYIPFSKLYTKDKKSVSLYHIQSWGITAVMSENQHIQYQFGDVAFLRGSAASMKSSYFFVSITGGDSLTIPKVGSMQTNFGTKIRDMNGNPVKRAVTYSLKDHMPGVSISKTGELELDSSCTAETITILAKPAGSANVGQLTVTLLHPGTAASLAVPETAVVPQLTLPVYALLNQYMNLIRIVAVFILLILSALVYQWFYKASTHNKKIKKELYQNDQESEENP